MTGESWCEMVVRPLLLGWDPRNAIVTGIFFISFVLITAVVLRTRAAAHRSRRKRLRASRAHHARTTRAPRAYHAHAPPVCAVVTGRGLQAGRADGLGAGGEGVGVALRGARPLLRGVAWRRSKVAACHRRRVLGPARRHLIANAFAPLALAPLAPLAMAENVVVTVLLDKFLASNDEQETMEIKAAAARMEVLLTALGEGASSSSPSPMRGGGEAAGGLEAWVKGAEYAKVRADMNVLMAETAWAKDAIASVLEALPQHPAGAVPIKKTISLQTEKVAAAASVHPGSSKRSPIVGSPMGAPKVV